MFIPYLYISTFSKGVFSTIGVIYESRMGPLRALILINMVGFHAQSLLQKCAANIPEISLFFGSLVKCKIQPPEVSDETVDLLA